MKLYTCAIAFVLGLAAAGPAAAADSPPLRANSPWTVDYDTESCALRRTFGEGDSKAYLEVRRFAPGLVLQTTIASSNMRTKRSVNFKYRFNGDTEWRKTIGANSVTLASGYEGVLFDSEIVDLPEYDKLEDELEREAYLRSIDWRAIEKAVAAKTETITLRGAFSKELALQLGALDKPITALNECVDELMTHWGIDVEAHKTLTRPAVPVNLSEIPSMMDYPPAMLQKSMPGLVNVRLAINETGKITACHIQMPLSDPVFEESSCADIEHLLDFDPALDKDGKPIASYWVTRVHFQLAR